MDASPHIPNQSFYFAATENKFLFLFRMALGDMWRQLPQEDGQILTELNPTFNLVTTREVADAISASNFHLKLREATHQHIGILFSAKLNWDDLTPAGLRHLESDMPATLPDDAPLATPRPHIYSNALYLTKEEARAMGLPA